MRYKALFVIILTTVLVFGLGMFWFWEETRRVSADILNFSSLEPQPTSVENSKVSLFLVSRTKVTSEEKQIFYFVTYVAKQDLKDARLVGLFGAPSLNNTPQLVRSLGDLKAGASGTISFPATISQKQEGWIFTRVVLSDMERPHWWAKEKRTVIAVVDETKQTNLEGD